MKYRPTSKKHIKFSKKLLDLARKANFLRKPQNLELILEEVKRKLPRTVQPARYRPKSPTQTANDIVVEETEKAFAKYHPDGSKRMLDNNGEVI